MNQKQRLLFVTGTRADYGKIEPLAKAAIQNGFDVTFFCHWHAYDGKLRADQN